MCVLEGIEGEARESEFEATILVDGGLALGPGADRWAEPLAVQTACICQTSVRTDRHWLIEGPEVRGSRYITHRGSAPSVAPRHLLDKASYGALLDITSSFTTTTTTTSSSTTQSTAKMPVKRKGPISGFAG